MSYGTKCATRFVVVHSSLWLKLKFKIEAETLKLDERYLSCESPLRHRGRVLSNNRT